MFTEFLFSCRENFSIVKKHFKSTLCSSPRFSRPNSWPCFLSFGPKAYDHLFSLHTSFSVHDCSFFVLVFVFVHTFFFFQFLWGFFFFLGLTDHRGDDPREERGEVVWSFITVALRFWLDIFFLTFCFPGKGGRWTQSRRDYSIL